MTIIINTNNTIAGTIAQKWNNNDTLALSSWKKYHSHWHSVSYLENSKQPKTGKKVGIWCKWEPQEEVINMTSLWQRLPRSKKAISVWDILISYILQLTILTCAEYSTCSLVEPLVKSKCITLRIKTLVKQKLFQTSILESAQIGGIPYWQAYAICMFALLNLI